MQVFNRHWFHINREIDAIDLGDPAALAGLLYLRGCLQEAMRLWPTTNFLMRTSKLETTICGARVPAGTTILMVNEINSLNPATEHGTAPAAHFSPERWADGAGPYHHFGGGGQRCPGEEVALLIAAGVLATLHDVGPYRTSSPEIESAERLPESYNPFELEMERV